MVNPLQLQILHVVRCDLRELAVALAVVVAVVSELVLRLFLRLQNTVEPDLGGCRRCRCESKNQKVLHGRGIPFREIRYATKSARSAAVRLSLYAGMGDVSMGENSLRSERWNESRRSLLSISCTVNVS